MLSLNNSFIKVYQIEGMTCASCSQVIEGNTANIPGLKSIQINFATEKAELKVDESFNEEIFKELLNKLGYKALSPNEFHETLENYFLNVQFYKAIFSLSIGMLSMSLAMGPII